MLYLVTGGSGSGKSAYAEQIAVELYGAQNSRGKLYYVATMYPYEDGETGERIARHRLMRQGKGFETIECYTELAGLETMYLHDESSACHDVWLVECMSNLLANEMYLASGGLKADSFMQDEIKKVYEKIEERIIAPLMWLHERGGSVVVVTNEIFSDGCVKQYDRSTRLYIELLGYINRRLAALADVSTEVVCGIPVILGGKE